MHELEAALAKQPITINRKPAEPTRSCKIRERRAGPFAAPTTGSIQLPKLSHLNGNLHGPTPHFPSHSAEELSNFFLTLVAAATVEPSRHSNATEPNVNVRHDPKPLSRELVGARMPKFRR
jgi:hypothetical protein